MHWDREHVCRLFRIVSSMLCFASPAKRTATNSPGNTSTDVVDEEDIQLIVYVNVLDKGEEKLMVYVPLVDALHY